VPWFNTISRICDDEGNEVAVGEVGEIVSEGPQVVPGYWNKPEKTAESFRTGRFHTGDVGFMDSEGWFYLVDRKKDMINAAGYKVWPREVEDVLYTHPAVREAGVIGVPDEYRGESVKAVISLKPGTQTTPEEIIAFCKERMAAYKYPRSVEIVEDLPKTVTGKILRRELRT
jgi:long-chain acyl-CoA synthetase